MWALSRFLSRKPTLSAGKAFYRYFSTLSGKHFQQAPAITLRFFEDPRELELDVPANQNLQKVEGSWTAIDQEKLRKCITDDVDAVINGNGTQWKGWWPIQYSRRAYLYEHHHASGLVIETEFDDIPEYPKNQTPPELNTELKIARAVYNQIINGPKTPKPPQKAVLWGSSNPDIPLYNDSLDWESFDNEPDPLDELPIDPVEAAYLAQRSREADQDFDRRAEKELQEYLRKEAEAQQQPEKTSIIDVAKSAALLYPQSESSSVKKIIRKAEGDHAGVLETPEPRRFEEKPSNPDADLDVEIRYDTDSDESAPSSLVDIIKADSSSSELKSTGNSPYNGGLDDVYKMIDRESPNSNAKKIKKWKEEKARNKARYEILERNKMARAIVDEKVSNCELEEEARAMEEQARSILKEVENPMPAFSISPQPAEGHQKFVMGQSIVPTGIPSCETFLVREVPPEIRSRTNTVSILPFYYDRYGRTHFILREVEFEKSKILSEEEIKRQSVLPEVDQALDRLTSKNPILVRTVGDVKCKEAMPEEAQKPVRVLSDWTSFGQLEITNPNPFFMEEKFREQFGHMADSDHGRAEARAVESFHFQFGRDVIGWDTLSGIVQTSLLGPSRWPFFWLEDCRHLMFLMQMPTPGTGLVGSEVNWEEWNGREVGGWRGEALKRHLSKEDNDSYDTPASLERAEQRLRDKAKEWAANLNEGFSQEEQPNLDDLDSPPTVKEKAEFRKWKEEGMLGLNKVVWGNENVKTISEEEIEGEDEDEEDEVDSEPLPDRETAPLVKADRPDVKLRTRVRVVTLEKFVELDDLVRSQQDGTVVLPPHLRNIEKTIPFQEILLHVSKYNPYAADLPYNPF